MRISLELALEKHAASVYAAAFQLLRQRQDAEDVVQDTFLRYYTGKKQFQSEEHLRAWLLRTAINRAKDLLRSAHRRDFCLDDVLPPPDTPTEDSAELFSAVLALPEAYRTVIHLFYYEDYSVKQIADLLHLSQAAVKTRLHRGRQALGAHLREDWEHDERGTL